MKCSRGMNKCDLIKKCGVDKKKASKNGLQAK